MKNKKLFRISIFLIISIILYLTAIDSNTNAFNNIITFLSIASGFSITSLSIIANSSFSKKLYKIEDKNDNSKTLLHILVKKFHSSLIIFILTISMILFFLLFEKSLSNTTFYMKWFDIKVLYVFTSIILTLTIYAFYFFISLLNIFTKYVIKSATNNS
ncbi:MAG: hypothetical protein JW870_06915 [Candidatus Delongbacteria bacterium]|nr:hypothetical protein [Candidatus Delongbacteria bacterium]